MALFPIEIWSQIVRDLSTTIDLLNFCKSSVDFQCLLRDEHLGVKNFDLGGCFEFYRDNIYEFISLHVRYDQIKYLNINKLYWVNLVDIRSIIRLLPNLEELCALDTYLGMRDEDVILFKKLRKLAVSVKADQFTSRPEVYRENLACLKSLCLKLVSMCKAHFRFGQAYFDVFDELRGLNELWLYDADEVESQCPLRYDSIIRQFRKLNKLVIKSKTILSTEDHEYFGFTKIYVRRRNNITTLCYVKPSPPETVVLEPPFFSETYERLKAKYWNHLPRYRFPQEIRRPSSSEVFESRILKAWDIIRTFLTETPCSFKDSLDIYNFSNSMKPIEFTELTFYHTKACDATIVNSALEILLSKHARNLQKLCLTRCILQEENEEQFEKQNVFKLIINNCPHITELEMVNCPRTCPMEIENVIGAYELICNLKFLKKLTLEIPAYLNGAFLKDVFMTCSELQTVHIKSEDRNEELNSVIYSYIHHAQKLTNFRFENIHIDLDRLFSALNTVQNSRLRRIVVKCDYDHSTQLRPIEELLERNRDIILFTIIVAAYNTHQTSELQELLCKFKDHPAKIYIAKTNINPKEGIFIPEAHTDISYFNSDVSVLHFSDF